MEKHFFPPLGIMWGQVAFRPFLHAHYLQKTFSIIYHMCLVHTFPIELRFNIYCLSPDAFSFRQNIPDACFWATLVGKVICNSFAQYFCGPFCTLLQCLCDLKISPTSRGLCWCVFNIISRDIEVTCEWNFCGSLLSVMHIMSNLVLRILRKVTNSFMCEYNGDCNSCLKVIYAIKW